MPSGYQGALTKTGRSKQLQVCYTHVRCVVDMLMADPTNISVWVIYGELMHALGEALASKLLTLMFLFLFLVNLFQVQHQLR